MHLWHIVASEPLDSLWKVSAGLITPLLLEAWRRARKGLRALQEKLDKVDAMATAIDQVQRDVHAATVTITEHSATIANLTVQLANGSAVTDVVSRLVSPLERMAVAAELYTQQALPPPES